MSGLLVRLFGGWRIVRIQGPRAERLISALANHGYRMWRIERHRDELEGMVTQTGYEVLIALAKEAGVEVVTVRRGGLPFRWRQMRRRPFLFAGLVTALLMVWYATGHIWVVEVAIPNMPPAQQEQLLQNAEAAGLRVGASRSIDIHAVRRHMLQTLPGYSWIGLHTDGVVAVIDGIRIVKRPDDYLPPKLVANANGKVTSIFVYIGSAEVMPGEEVRRGQTLITGVVTGEPPGQEEAKDKKEESVVTPAEGEVLANVNYQVKVFQPFRKEVGRPTGKVYVQRFLEFDRRSIVEIPHLTPLPFRYYDVQKKVQTVRFAGVDLPVRIIEMVYNEKVIKSVPLKFKAAARLAQERAAAEIRQEVPKGSIRVRQSEKLVQTKGGLWVTLTWVMNRNIAEPPSRGKK